MRRWLAARSPEQRTEILADALLVGGLACVALGCALLAAWLGLVVAGLEMLALAWALVTFATKGRDGEPR